MKVCHQCGGKVEKGSWVCPHCGFDLTAQLFGTTGIKKVCPDCGKRVDRKSKYCSYCGLVFFTRPAKPERPSREEKTPEEPVKTDIRIKKAIILALLAGVVIVAVYRVQNRSEIGLRTEPAEERRTRLVPIPVKDSIFDEMIQMPHKPLNTAWNGNGFLIQIQQKPPEFLQLKDVENAFEPQKIVGLHTQRREPHHHLAWNGQNYVGYREAGPSKDPQFVVYDPSTMRVTEQFPAPDPIGGLTWDGTLYWAASLGKDQPRLYQLDKEFRIVNQFNSPSNNCEGLAWGGGYLWFLDSTQGKVFVLSVAGSQVSLTYTYQTDLKSLNGITFDGEHIWISESEGARLLRLNPRTVELWALREDGQIVKPFEEEKHLSDFAALRGTYLQTSGDVEVNEFSARFQSGTLYASWKVYFGKDLFLKKADRTGDEPIFAGYTVTIHGENLSTPIAKVYQAFSGANLRDNEEIARDLIHGAYRIGLFLYAQYVDEYGTSRIVTRSAGHLDLRNNSQHSETSAEYLLSGRNARRYGGKSLDRWITDTIILALKSRKAKEEYQARYRECKARISAGAGQVQPACRQANEIRTNVRESAKEYDVFLKKAEAASVSVEWLKAHYDWVQTAPEWASP